MANSVDRLSGVSSMPVAPTGSASYAPSFASKARGSVAGLVAAAIMAATSAAQAADCPDGQEKVEKCVPKKTAKKPAGASMKCVGVDTKGKLYLADNADAPKDLSDETIEQQVDGSFIIQEGQTPAIPVRCLEGKKEITKDKRLLDIFANMKITVDGVEAVRKVFIDNDMLFITLPDLEAGTHLAHLMTGKEVVKRYVIRVVAADAEDAVDDAEDVTPPAKKDEPKKDEPKKDEPKKDEPKKDEPKKDEPKKDEPKKEGGKFGGYVTLGKPVGVGGPDYGLTLEARQPLGKGLYIGGNVGGEMLSRRPVALSNGRVVPVGGVRGEGSVVVGIEGASVGVEAKAGVAVRGLDAAHEGEYGRSKVMDVTGVLGGNVIGRIGEFVRAKLGFIYDTGAQTTGGSKEQRGEWQVKGGVGVEF